MKLDELKKVLRDCGVVGAGGAGFPSYAKLDSRADTIILNCAECEPLLKLHRQVLEQFAFEILSALQIIADTVGAKDVIIAVKPSYKQAVAAVEARLHDFKNMRIGPLPEVYPAGDEVITIYETTGRVVPAGQIPIAVGVTVFNVETMLNAYFALQKGTPVTEKYITITGAVHNPVTLKVPLGITAAELIEMAGGAVVEDYTLINGGPMTGTIMKLSDVITKTSNAILVMPVGHYIVQKRLSNPTIEIKRAMGSCCQCKMCTDLCPRNLLGHPIQPHTFMRSATSGVTSDVSPYLGSYFCCSCGLCELYSCFQGLSPRTLLSVTKSGLRQNGVPMPKVPEKSVSAERGGRYITKSRLTARLGLTEYNHPAKLQTNEVTTKKAKLMLSQHIGAPAVPVVKVGDSVECGQLIAACDESKLGTNIHSSLKGKVLKVTNQYIIVGRGGKN